QISALGTDDGAASRFHLSKREADDVLRSLSLEWFVLRPSLVVGGKSTGWLRRLANLPVWVLPGTGNQVLQPVHLRDVTDSVLQCLEDHLPPRQTIDLVGPEALSLKEFLLLLRRADQRNAPWIWLIPVNWLMAIAHLAAPFAPLFSPDNLAMLHRSVIADGAPFARLLGRNPYSIEASCREERHELSAT
ncbi:MAG: short chain dehydrogenase, partial [Sulfuricella sp.]|nr:short chain dehydrogenase [Sulfuricella sp.]